MAEIIENSTYNLDHIRTRANSGNTLGIIGTALGGIGLLGGLGSLFGGNRMGGGCDLATKQWEDYIKVTREVYENELAKAEQRFTDREATNAQFFKLYDWNRDEHDSISKKVDELNAKVEVMAAVRPYQDQLIANQIQMAKDEATFNLFKRTAYCINGQVGIPDASVSTIPGYYPPVVF